MLEPITNYLTLECVENNDDRHSQDEYRRDNSFAHRGHVVSADGHLAAMIG